MFNLWLKNVLFSNKQTVEIQNRIKRMDVPNTIGRLPIKIMSNAGSFTAEQWKNWTLIYSIYCLKGILPENHLKCWQTYVLACKYICKPIISATDINIADGLFLKFCKEIETLYGKLVITPNMHLHCHLKDVLLDHGPVPSFWCFSFERYNGILGSTTTNKRSVELQLMRRFKLSHFLEDGSFPCEFKDNFLHICVQNKNDDKEDWIKSAEWSEKSKFRSLAVASPLPLGDVWKNKSGILCPRNFKVTPLDSDDAKLLLQVFHVLYPGCNIDLKDMCETIEKFGSLTIAAMTFGSKLMSRGIRSAKILASWTSNGGFINKETFLLRPGTVLYYFNHSCIIKGEYTSHTFACVKWNRQDTNIGRIGNPIQVWQSTYEDGGQASFIPVQRIFSHFASAKLNDNGTICTVVSPISRKIFL